MSDSIYETFVKFVRSELEKVDGFNQLGSDAQALLLGICCAIAINKITEFVCEGVKSSYERNH